MFTSVHRACPQAAYYWLELFQGTLGTPAALFLFGHWTPMGVSFEGNDQCKTCAEPQHGWNMPMWEVADSEPDSVYENRYRSHRATKAKEKKSLERKRYQEVHQSRPGASGSPWKKSRDRLDWDTGGGATKEKLLFSLKKYSAKRGIVFRFCVI